MNIKSLLFALLPISVSMANAQQNLIISPEKPKAGDVITITYTPAGELANTLSKVEASVALVDSKRIVNDLPLTKSGKKYRATIKTDTADTFVQLTFFIEGNDENKYDTNFGNGYYILLNNNNNSVKKSAYAALGVFYQYEPKYIGGIENDKGKALAAFEKELSLYPESINKYYSYYYSLISSEKKDEAPTLLQKEIESILKTEPKTEKDYIRIATLYRLLKLPEQEKFFMLLEKEKFPNGSWTKTELINKFYAEKDLEKKKILFNEIEHNIATKEDWKETNLSYYQQSLLSSYISNKQWDELKKVIAQLSETEKGSVASVYNNVAWNYQEKNENLDKAEEFASYASDYAKQEWKKPTAKKPDYYTGKQWDKSREGTYAMYADTYAMVEYRLGKYDKGYPITKEAAITINKGKDVDNNNTYALLAEKVLPQANLKDELQQFVRNGKANSTIKDILKKIYVTEKKSEDSFDAYIEALEKEAHLKMVAELKKSMVNEPTKSFVLKDYDGNLVNTNDLKGKIVIVDFWATWCGPCKASFPGMQKLVTKYKDNADVKFLFVNTFENDDNKEKNAKDFITTNNYSFHVLMDNDNTVVNQFKVSGIPTKFVLDNTGNIRFKSIGFDGNDEKLISEVSTVIDLINSNSTN